MEKKYFSLEFCSAESGVPNFLGYPNKIVCDPLVFGAEQTTELIHKKTWGQQKSNHEPCVVALPPAGEYYILHQHFRVFFPEKSNFSMFFNRINFPQTYNDPKVEAELNTTF